MNTAKVQVEQIEENTVDNPAVSNDNTRKYNKKTNAVGNKRGISLTPRIDMSDLDVKRLKTLLEAFRYFKLMTKSRRQFVCNLYDQLVVNGRTPTINQMTRLREAITFTNMQIFPNDSFTTRRVRQNKEKRESIAQNFRTDFEGKIHPEHLR